MEASRSSTVQVGQNPVIIFFRDRWAESFVAVLIFLLISTSVVNLKKLETADRFLAPPEFVAELNFGFRNVIGDSLYVRSLQDLRFCEEKIKFNQCKDFGWIYKMFSMVSLLSPDWRDFHQFAGSILSIIVSDIGGATKFHDRAVTLYPKDWVINFQAGYQALIEEKNPAKAAARYETAAKNGGPKWLYDIVAKLYDETGQRQMAIEIYRQYKAKNQDEILLNTMRKRLNLPEDFE